MVRRQRRLGALIAAGLLLVGCGRTADGQKDRAVGVAGQRSDVDVSYASTIVQSPPGSLVGVPTRATDLLPNRLVPGPDGKSYPYVRVVVVAAVADVEPERATVWPTVDVNGDGPPEEVAFTSPAAESRTWLLRLKVTETLAGGSPQRHLASAVDGGTVLVRFVTGGGPVDVERFRSEMSSLDGSVWFLKMRQNWPDAFDVAWMGWAIAVVDEAGNLDFPLVAGEGSTKSDRLVLSLAELEDLAAKPDSVIEELRRRGS